MRIEKVTVRLGKTIPGPEYGGNQFGNVKPEIEITALLAEGDNTDATVAGLRDYCIAKLGELKQALIAEQTQIRPHQQSAPTLQVYASTPPPPPKSNTIPKVDPVTF